MIEIETLWEMIDEMVAPLTSVRISLDGALDAVLREDVRATEPNPPFDQSAMDGYALSDTASMTLRLLGTTTHAGDSGCENLQAGGAMRVLTGARIPIGTAAVAMQEDCTLNDGMVTLRKAAQPGEFVRKSGGIWKPGDILLESTRVLGAAEIGLLAGAGCLKPLVSPPVRVTHLITGNELHRGDTPPPPGCIRDVNGPLIRALAAGDGAEVRQQWLHDGCDDLTHAVKAADADLLLISGGSGGSERDHTRAALTDAGFTIHTQTINSRPGKPLIFATQGNRIAFGLPGNPLSHFVCYHVFVNRALRRMRGLASQGLIDVVLGSPLRDRGDGRRSWQPVRIEFGPHGLHVHPLPWHHSGDIRVMAGIDALLAADGIATPQPGEAVRILPLRNPFSKS